MRIYKITPAQEPILPGWEYAGQGNDGQLLFEQDPPYDVQDFLASVFESPDPEEKD